MKKIIAIFLFFFSFSFSNGNKNLSLRLSENQVEGMFHSAITHFLLGVNFNSISDLRMSREKFLLLKGVIKTNDISKEVEWKMLGLAESPFDKWRTLDKWLDACNIHMQKITLKKAYTPDSVVCFGNINKDIEMLDFLDESTEKFSARLRGIQNDKKYWREVLELEKTLTGNAQQEKMILQHLITHHLSKTNMPISEFNFMCESYQFSSRFAELGFLKALSIINSEDFYIKYGE